MACANSVTRPAVAKVPRIPSETIGTAATRKRRQPIDAPPSNKITTSATVTIVSTLETDGAIEGKRSEARAAPTRKKADDGILTEGDATARATKSPYVSIIRSI